MNRDDFRRVALALPEVEESMHQGNPDFRVRGKIFATLGPRDDRLAVVKFTREQQEMLASAEPAIFAQIPGGWGRKGWTHVRLDAADEVTLRSALTTAWRNVAPKGLASFLPASHSGP